MLRFVEVGLFLAPFVVFFVWRFVAVEGGPPMRIIIAMAVVAIALIGALAWLSQEEALPPGTVYQPAHFEDGRVVPGRAVPR